jgi:hypothetical protein
MTLTDKLDGYQGAERAVGTAPIVAEPSHMPMCATLSRTSYRERHGVDHLQSLVVGIRKHLQETAER